MGRPRLRRYEVTIDYTHRLGYFVQARDPNEARRRALELHRHDSRLREYRTFEVERIKKDDKRYW